MKKLIFITILLFITGNAFTADSNLADKLFTQDPISLELTSTGLTPSGKPTFKAVENPEDMNPGKALMLSAIIPGAGQYYAGNKIRAAIFFTIEVAAWYGVIHYYQKGQDMDKEFKRFADAHFDENVYRQWEFQLALEAAHGDSGAYPYHDINLWTALEWENKINYLPKEGFTHELPTQEDRNSRKSHDQQYYEMIGKYIRQFGFGWDDVYERDPTTGIIIGYRGDADNTPYYDNLFETAQISLLYMDMRYDSNKMLDYSSWAIQIAMLNHVAAALEASFSVRVMKRKAKAQLSFRQVYHNDHFLPVGGLSFKW